MAFFHVIIPAAGVGNRMANVLPKQYIPLGGKPMISHCIQVFFNHPRIAGIHVALNPEDDFWRSLTLEPESRLHLHYTGGATRAETVLNTLKAIEPSLQTDDWILVHDAARPGLTHDLLSRLISTIEHDEVGGLLALPVADTLKQSLDNQQVAQTIPRANLWQAQTPQMFRFLTLKNALSQFGASVTDEAEAIEALGLKPKLVQGELRNLKVTYPQDLELLEALFNAEKAKGNA
ncbi:MAG: 2-C-methyl-D-erythritol 4-phosphate cytidylyltransferase [Pseudomonadota bacterium]